mgnify:CR=1 FL=1
MRLAANLTLLFTEAPALRRPALAAQAGFDGVEVLFPYDHAIAEWQDALGDLPVALINTPPGDWAAGERGWAAVPGAETRFRDDFRRAVDHALGLKAGLIHVMSGIASGPEAEATLLRNLDWAAGQAGSVGLVIEPLNPIDMPGYFLNDFAQTARLLAQFDPSTVGLQVDLWHVWRLGRCFADVWRDFGPLARHIQIAGRDGRHEPDAGSAAELANLQGFSGWIAAEYIPSGPTSENLGWMDTVRGR